MAKSRDFDDLEEYVEDEDYEIDASYEYEGEIDNNSYDYEYDEAESLDDNYEVVDYDSSNYSDSDDTTDNYESYDEVDSKRDIDLFVIFGILSNWFIRLGIVLAICLVIMFFVTGKIMTAFLYVFGLIVAFSFGYVFMFCIDHFLSKPNNTENNSKEF